MMKLLKELWRNEDATSVVELGLVLPILAAFVIGIIDFSKAYSEKLRVEQAAQRAVERAMQGMQGNSSTVIFNALAQEAATAADVQVSNVTVRYWLECNGVSQFTTMAKMDEDYNKECSDGVYYSRHLNVRIVKSFTPIFRLNWPGTVNGAFTLSGEAGLRVQ